MISIEQEGQLFLLRIVGQHPKGYQPNWDAYIFEGVKERLEKGYPWRRLTTLVHRRADTLYHEWNSEDDPQEAQRSVNTHISRQIGRMRSATRRWYS